MATARRASTAAVRRRRSRPMCCMSAREFDAYLQTRETLRRLRAHATTGLEKLSGQRGTARTGVGAHAGASADGSSSKAGVAAEGPSTRQAGAA